MPTTEELLAEAKANADSASAARAAGGSAPKATPKKAAATPPPAEPVVTSPAPGAEPTDPPKEANSMDKLSPQEEESFEALKDVMTESLEPLFLTHIEPLFQKWVAPLYDRIDDLEANLKTALEKSTPFQAAPAPEPAKAKEPVKTFHQVVIERVHYFEIGTTADEPKASLRDLITALKGADPEASKSDMKTEVIDAIEDKKMEVGKWSTFITALEEVIEEVYANSSLRPATGSTSVGRASKFLNRGAKPPKPAKPAEPPRGDLGGR